MGQFFSRPSSLLTEKQFWDHWYATKHDYSVGYAATIAVDPYVNETNRNISQKILKKYKVG